MIMEIYAAGATAFLVGQAVYHRWFEDKPLEKIKPQEVSIPRVDEGSPIPLIYGRCRVRAPILAWTDTPVRGTGDGGGNGWPLDATFYKMTMFFVVGIPFQSGTTKMHGMWSGDRKFAWFGAPTETHGTQHLVELEPSADAEAGYIGTNARWYDGRSTQDLGADLPGARMIASGIDVFQIPSYFDYLTILLYSEGYDQQWMVGSSPNIAAYSFEASSYKDSGGYPAVGIYAQCGLDSNPINVIYDILIGAFGKLGIPTSYIDKPSFQAAATKLYTEGHGYSRATDGTMPADELIQEILRQIDGALDEDPTTGKLVITLVRPDYDPADAMEITNENCRRITNLAMNGWADLPSAVRVIFPNRETDYNDDSIFEPNQGNTVDSGEAEEVQIQYPGCPDPLTAAHLALREMHARTRPTMKMCCEVGPEFRNLRRGQVVKVTYSNPDIAGLMFRVANVNRGTKVDSMVQLDLILDTFFVTRNEPATSPFPYPPGKPIRD